MYFRNYLPLEKGGAIHLANLNSLYPRMVCAKFVWNWLSGSGEEDFLKFVILFSLFLNYLPLEKGGALHLLFTQGCFVQRLVEIGSVVLEKRFFLISSMYFRKFIIISLWKRAGPFIWKKNLIPFTQKCFMQSLVESGSMVLMKIIFLILSMYFPYYLPLEKCEALCLNKHESPSYKDDLVKLP